MDTYKITKKTQLLYADHMIWHTVIYLGVLVCLYAFSLPDKNTLPLVYSCFYFPLFVIWLIVHYNYYKTNKNDEFSIDNSSDKEYLFSSNNETIGFSVSDIKVMYVYKSFALQRDSIRFLTWDNYYHIKIILNSGKTIILTSLMFGGEIQIPVEEEKIIRKLNLFRIVRQKSLT